MALANRIDPATAAAALERWLGEPVRDLSVPTASGLSCETVLFTAGGRPYVARVAPPDGTGLFPTYWLEDEARIMRTLADSTPVPAPHVVGVELDPSVLGGRFLVMDRIAGRVPPDDPPYSLAGWVLDLSPAEQHRLLDNALATVVAVAQVDWAGLDLRLSRIGIAKQVEFLEHLYVTGHQDRAHPVIEAGLDHLRTNAPQGEAMALSWGDARIGNMLFADDLTVAGALDWELASIGSPELDLAYFLYALRLWSEGYGAPRPTGFPDREAILARYTEFSGHTPRNLDYYERYAATFGALAVMRAGHLMTEAGILPPDSTMWLINPASVMLAGYLGVDVPAGEVTGWAGHR